MDLSPAGGPKEGWILENFFQEVDVETGKLLFEWKASDHVPVSETMLALTENNAKTPGGALDYFHINTVMGGKDNTFQDLSDGRAVDFTGQHDAHLYDNNTLSIFDNGKFEWKDHVAGYSRGMLVSLDTEHMTTTLLREFADPKRSKLTQSQGSVQAIKDFWNWPVSYGLLPTFTEFGENGQVVFDVDIAPGPIYGVGMVTSYRVFKTRKCAGRPVQPPNAFLGPSEGVLYPSWHGATEIDRWILDDADWKGVDGNNYISSKPKRRTRSKYLLPLKVPCRRSFALLP
ncbi:hypothetical protein DL768_002703 [Monosporascus sp. mg162]|nr:hypothetical protein DL768_002703 [Monosporascus sp. mg162]